MGNACNRQSTPSFFEPAQAVHEVFALLAKVKAMKRPVFIGFSAPKRFFKENAFCVTVTVTKRPGCDITAGCAKNVKCWGRQATGQPWCVGVASN